MPQKFLLTYPSFRYYKPPPCISQMTRTFSSMLWRRYCWLSSKSIINGEEVGEVTFELLDHVLMVLNSLLQDHFRLVHLPPPLCAHWICMMSEGKRELFTVICNIHIRSDASSWGLWHCLITLKATRNLQQYPASDTTFRCHLWPPFSYPSPYRLWSPQKEERTLQFILNLTYLFWITGKRFLS